MAAKFTVSGDKVTVSFSYTAPTTLVQLIIDDCAESLWVEEFDEEGEVLNPFESATNQEKLDIADVLVKRVLIEKANTHKSLKAQKAAAKVEADAAYAI